MKVGLAPSAALLICACASVAPPAAKYFDRSTPLEAVKMFQYAVEAKQYHAAYACLSPETQELLSPAKFRFCIRYLSIEEWQGVGLREFIIGARRGRVERAAGDGSSAEVWLLFLPPDDRLEMPDIFQSFHLIRVDGEWRIDLTRIRGVNA